MKNPKKRTSHTLAKDELGERIGFSLSRINLKVAAVVGPAIFIGLSFPPSLPIIIPIVAGLLIKRSKALQKGERKVTSAQFGLDQRDQVESMLANIAKKTGTSREP